MGLGSGLGLGGQDGAKDLPEAALGEGLDVALDAAAHHHDALRPEVAALGRGGLLELVELTDLFLTQVLNVLSIYLNLYLLVNT